jgi:2-methylisocitrate lyase-like PEP mutase family enzyme
MNGQPQKPVAGVVRLREMLSDPSHTVVAPGVYDGISARLALAAGFDCLYMASILHSSVYSTI